MIRPARARLRSAALGLQSCKKYLTSSSILHGVSYIRTSTILSSDELDALERLGRTVRLARLRRNLTQAELAERMGVARPSVVALESGHPGVGIGILLKALSLFGYTERLRELLAADPVGDDMAEVTGRSRAAGQARHVADF